MWYAYPFLEVMGVGKLIILMSAIHFGTGVVLTVLLISSKKTSRALLTDSLLIIAIQTSALVYGLHVLSNARPVVLVFEVDRFVAVAKREILASELSLATPPLNHLSLVSIRLVGTKMPNDTKEFLSDLDLSLQGIERSLRPSWWIPYEEALPKIALASRPLTTLLARKPEAREIIEKTIRDFRFDTAKIRYLPLTSGYTRDWIVLLGPGFQPVGYAHIDGF
jgi:hypothetical protein